MSQPPSDNLKIVVTEIDPLNNKEAGDAGDAGDAESLGIENHAKVLRKLDWHILPLISTLNLLSAIDRASFGNAQIAGMDADLELVGLRYNTAVAIFFVSYCLAQIPSNILLKVFRPSRWIPMIMVVWGLTMTLMCLVTTYKGLLVARFFLGLAEAGLFPGLILYISSWYPRAERAKRLAMFTSPALAAGAFSGVLSYVLFPDSVEYAIQTLTKRSAIEKMEGLGGLHGWQWIFCLEGIVAVLAALAAPFFIYDRAETVSFLTESERHYVIEILKADLQGLSTNYDFRFVLQALKDYKIFIQLGIVLCLIIPTSAVSFFTPTIISELNFSVTDAQLLSAPPYVAGCICTVVVGIYSDKLRLRGPFVIGGALVGLVGFTVLYTQTNPGASLVGVVLGVMGIFSSTILAFAWATTNVGGEVKRSVGIAMINGFGNLGGMCSVFIFFDPPRFHVAIAIIMALLCMTILLTLFAMWNYHKINKKRELECRRLGITDDQMNDFRDCGDESPLFRYTI